MRILLTLLTLLLPALARAPLAHAQAFDPAQRQEIIGILRDALRKDPSILRDAMTALQTDDLRRQEQATRDVLALLGPRITNPQDPVAGNPFGDVTIVEFYDTRCPYCRNMIPVMAELIRTDPGVKLVMKDIPILGPGSQLESKALLAAQRQGGYFKLQEHIMLTPGTPTRDSLRADADSLGLDGGRIMRDMDDQAIKSQIQANMDLAKHIGVDGTPAIVIGQHMIAGATTLTELRQAVAEARTK